MLMVNMFNKFIFLIFCLVAFPFYCLLSFAGFTIYFITEIFAFFLRGDPQSRRRNRKNLKSLSKPFSSRFFDE